MASLAGLIASEVERLMSRGQSAQAESIIRRALARDGADPGLNQVMALFLTGQQKHEQAVHFARKAVAGAPHGAELQYTLGLCLTNTPQRAQAVDAFNRALRLEPKSPRYALALGRLYLDLYRADEAEPLLCMAVDAITGSAEPACVLARLLTETGRADESLALLRRTHEKFGGDAGARVQMAATMNYVDGLAALEVAQAHRAVGSLYFPRPVPHPPTPSDPNRPLRIGILSTDLRRHSVAYFLEPLLEHRDRHANHIYCYATGGRRDDVSQRLEQLSEGWHEVTQWDDQKLFRQMRSDRLDILVDLIGLLESSRLSLLAQRPAPVQVTYLGYPNTTGLAAVGHRIVDACTDPPGSEALSTERLERMPTGCFLCYRPDPNAPPVQPRTEGPLTFGSYNTLVKVSNATVALWGQVLAAVPGSRLMLKAGILGQAAVRERTSKRLSNAGVDPSRVTMLGWDDSPDSHLARYHAIDIALDTYPYNGTTTTCEALWMGVPVVSLVGDRHASRVGLSLLSAVGLPEFAAANPDQFVQVARSLAQDGQRLAALRAGLRAQMKASVLCDGPRQAAAFFGLLRGAWRSWAGC